MAQDRRAAGGGATKTLPPPSQWPQGAIPFAVRGILADCQALETGVPVSGATVRTPVEAVATLSAYVAGLLPALQSKTAKRLVKALTGRWDEV